MTRWFGIASLLLCAAPVFGDEETHHVRTAGRPRGRARSNAVGPFAARAGQYAKGERVTLWMNKVGPYANPQETYQYYSLPFCEPETKLEPKTKHAGIGQVLEGTEFVNSGLDIPFAQDVPRTRLCTARIGEEEARKFEEAVHRHFWYQAYFDDLPVWGMVGEVRRSVPRRLLAGAPRPVRRARRSRPAVPPQFRALQVLGLEDDYRTASVGAHTDDHTSLNVVLYTHKALSVAYNEDRVIEVNLTSSNPQTVVPGSDLQFTFEVRWKPTTRLFDNRFNRYLDYKCVPSALPAPLPSPSRGALPARSFFEHQIHWFSVFNSFMMVVFLCGLVALILLRTVRNDFARYAREDDDVDSGERGLADDSGWKQVHADVFRRPPYPALYAALRGSGAQLIIMAFTVTLLAIAGSLYIEHGGVTTAMIAVHALTSIVNGYVSGSYYAQQFYPHPAPAWIKTMLLSASLFPGVLTAIGFVLNVLALSYDTIHALPIGTLVAMAMIFLFVTLPLAVVGTILGRHWNGTRDVPCRITVLPRAIPEKPWFARHSVRAGDWEGVGGVGLGRRERHEAWEAWGREGVGCMGPGSAPLPALRCDCCTLCESDPRPLSRSIAGADSADRRPPLRRHLHRDVLPLHLLLELQVLLRVRLHAPRPHHPPHRLRLRDHRGHLLPAQRRGLPLALDLVPRLRLHRRLRAPLLRLLLLPQNQHARPAANLILLRLHRRLLRRPLPHVRHHGLVRQLGVCPYNLQEHQG